MRLLLLVPLAALLACASEPGADAPAARASGPAATPTRNAVHSAPAAADTLDLRRWLEDALALDEIEDYEERLSRARALTDQLATATGWKAACGEDEPEGNLVLYPLRGGDYVAEFTCFLAAYQVNFTLLLVSPERAALLPLPLYDEAGNVVDPAATNFGGLLMDDDPADRRFAIFTKYRGMGDCGEWSRFEVAEDGSAEAVEVRMRDCDQERPDELPPPGEWPLVYAR